MNQLRTSACQMGSSKKCSSTRGGINTELPNGLITYKYLSKDIITDSCNHHVFVSRVDPRAEQ